MLLRELPSYTDVNPSILALEAGKNISLAVFAKVKKPLSLGKNFVVLFLFVFSNQFNHFSSVREHASLLKTDSPQNYS